MAPLLALYLLLKTSSLNSLVSAIRSKAGFCCIVSFSLSSILFRFARAFIAAVSFSFCSCCCSSSSSSLFSTYCSTKYKLCWHQVTTASNCDGHSLENSQVEWNRNAITFTSRSWMRESSDLIFRWGQRGIPYCRHFLFSMLTPILSVFDASLIGRWKYWAISTKVMLSICFRLALGCFWTGVSHSEYTTHVLFSIQVANEELWVMK